MKIIYRLLFVVIGIAQSNSVKAQTSSQLWYEYMLNYPFANSFNFESAFTYSTVLEQPKWRSLEYNGTVEYSITSNFDLLGSGLISYTAQTESYNTVEIRPMIGTRIFFTPNHRIQTRLLLRLEDRFIQDLDTKVWESTIRPRARAEFIIPITQDSYFKDNLWYAVVDAEWLFAVTDVDERFANRFRFRIGPGYRLSHTWRFELLYMSQESKNAINDSFNSNENIIRIRLKHFLRKTKPTKAQGSGG